MKNSKMVTFCPFDAAAPRAVAMIFITVFRKQKIGFEVATSRDDRFCGRPAADPSALLHDFWSACSMDGTVNTSSSNKTAVCCVHDRVC
jgi:hypothetical protein